MANNKRRTWRVCWEIQVGIFCMICANAFAQVKPTLVFVQQGGNLDFDDQLIEHFENSFDVQPFDSTDPDVIDAASDAALVYVTESIGSSSIAGGDGTIFQDLENPVIYAEAFAFDDAKLTGFIIHDDFGNTGRPEALATSDDVLDVSDSLFITNPAHPLAAGFEGTVAVYTEEFSLNYALGETMGPGAEIIATADEAGNYPTIFVYEPGTELEDGSTTPGMRIGVFVGQSSSVPDVPSPIPFDILSEDGLTLIDAAVGYAAGILNPTDPCDFDGDGIFGVGDIDLLNQEIQAGTNHAKFDITGDGHVDGSDLNAFVTGETKLHTWIGDANLDGEFNSSDFVAVFQEGLFETAQKATWSQGDWNGDGQFSSTDFVVAFQDGGFELGPRWQGVQAVPEPRTLLWTALSLFGLVVRQKRR